MLTLSSDTWVWLKAPGAADRRVRVAGTGVCGAKKAWRRSQGDSGGVASHEGDVACKAGCRKGRALRGRLVGVCSNGSVCSVASAVAGAPAGRAIRAVMAARCWLQCAGTGGEGGRARAAAAAAHGCSPRMWARAEGEVRGCHDARFAVPGSPRGTGGNRGDWDRGGGAEGEGGGEGSGVLGVRAAAGTGRGAGGDPEEGGWRGVGGALGAG